MQNLCGTAPGIMPSVADEPRLAVLDGDAPSQERASEDAHDYAELRARLSRAVQRICPAWLSGQSEDIVQEAMIRVMRIIASEGGERALQSSYLYRVAHSATIDEIRKRRRSREVALGEQQGAELTDATSPSPAQRAEAEQIKLALGDCLAELNADRRRAVVLYLQGHGVTEAARLLGFGHKRTENLVYRGLASLRDCLSGKGFSL